MRTRAPKLAWSLCGLCVVLTLGAFVLAILGEPARGEGTNRFVRVVLGVVLLVYPTVGALIASRRPENPIGWLLIVVGVGASISGFAAEYGVRAVISDPGSMPGGTIAVWTEEAVFSGVIFTSMNLVLLLFPQGRLLSRRWLPIAFLAVLSGVLLSVGTAFDPGRFDQDPFSSVENPYGIGREHGVFEGLANSGWILLLAVILASVLSVILRFRRSQGEEREQLKWIAAAAALLVGFWLVALFTDSVNVNVSQALFLLGVAIFPVSIGFAILKYRLYEIDRIINRALVYAVLTAGLAGLYFGIVIALQQIFGSLTRGNDLAIAGSTLAVAALFRPARRRIQELVDRRFYRHRYDAQQTLEAFSVRLRDEVDLDQLGAELGAVVHETMQPAHVSLWLRPQERGTMTHAVRSRLPWLITALTACLAVAALVLATISYGEPAGQTDHSLWFIVILAAILLPWSIIGALVASRRPENPIGWLFVFAALGMSVSAAANAYAEYSVLVRPLPATAWMAWVPTWLWNTSAIVAPLVLLLIFPDGRFLSVGGAS